MIKESKLLKGFTPLEIPKMCVRKKFLKGFTLVEVLVVVAIISILTGYTAFSFSLISPRHIDAQSRKLASDLCWVRDMAVAAHQNFTVDFDIANRIYNISKDGNVISSKTLDVDSISMDPQQVCFYYPKGTTQQSMQINLSYRGESKQITIFNDTGYIKWE